MSISAYDLQLRQYKGLCPDCGESGRLDPMGGAICSKHGLYKMVLVADPGTSHAPSGTLDVVPDCGDTQYHKNRDYMAGLSDDQLREQCIPALPPLNGAVMAQAFSLIKRHNLTVAYIRMNVLNYMDFRFYCRDLMDIETEVPRLKAGIVGCLFGATIFVDKNQPMGLVTLMSELKPFKPLPTISSIELHRS